MAYKYYDELNILEKELIHGDIVLHNENDYINYKYLIKNNKLIDLCQNEKIAHKPIIIKNIGDKEPFLKKHKRGRPKGSSNK